MNLHTVGRMLLFLALAGLAPLHAAESEGISIHLIIGNSPALGNAMDEVSRWVSRRFLDRGSRITLWGLGGPESGSQYSGEPVNWEDIASGDMGAPLRAAARSAAARGASAPGASGASYAVLISASPADFSTLLEGPDAELIKYSRTEEFQGWQALIVALNIDAQVRRAAANWLEGN